jgi:hypothetical protein
MRSSSGTTAVADDRLIPCPGDVLLFSIDTIDHPDPGSVYVVVLSVDELPRNRDRSLDENVRRMRVKTLLDVDVKGSASDLTWFWFYDRGDGLERQYWSRVT